MSPSTGRRWQLPAAVRVEDAITLLVVAGTAAFVLLQLQPDLVFTSTTPTGGDNGGHLWAPAYLRDELLPRGRLSGWSPDFYGGFPAFRFYMVVPHLAIAVVSYVVPYEVAYKLFVAVGPVTLPVAAWFAGRCWRVPTPAPAFMAVFSLFFLFDDGYELYGGNVASTMAGEFAFSISLTLAVVYLGLLGRAVNGSGGRVLPAIVLAFVGLVHPIPSLLAVALTAAVVVERSARMLTWALRVGGYAALLAGFWIVPFWWQRGLMNDMGWPRLTTFSDELLRDDLRWVVVLAVVGVWATVVGVERLGRVLAATAVIGVAGVLLVPQGQLWNARLLPLVYLVLFLLAGLGASHLLRTVTAATDGARTESWFRDRSVRRVLVGLPVAMVAAGAVGRSVVGWPLDWLVELGLLAAIATLVLGGAEGFRLVLGHRTPVDARSGLVAGGAVLVFVVALIVVGLPLRILPGGVTNVDGTYSWLGLSTDQRNPAAGYARFDFAGMEARPGDGRGGGYLEYKALIETMDTVGAERGCGRAMWEYDDDLVRYGSTMSLQLLPYWTDGCIASFEGVYFESSPTVPYHFVTQAELSIRPSRAMWGIDYPSFDVARGARHLRELGVRYYLAFSEPAVASASALPGVDEIARSGPWVVFELPATSLVEPVASRPVVLDGVADGVGDWTEPALALYQSSESEGVLVAASGPDDWPHVEWSGSIAPVVAAGRDPLPPVTISEVDVGVDRISFVVSEPGIPVLVKASYFPNWEVTNGDGPFRAGPNQMVVVPSGRNIELHYRTHPSEWLGWAATLLGVALLVRDARTRRRSTAR